MRPQVETGNHGKIVAIDIETGAFEIISKLLTILLLFSAILPNVAHAQATETAATRLNPSVDNQLSVNQISPFNLAYLAYHGYLSDQGIISGGHLINALESKTTSAQNIIQAAIKTNRLPEKALSDKADRYSLETQLQGLTGD